MKLPYIRTDVLNRAADSAELALLSGLGYAIFKIPKRNGKMRTISAPNRKLKEAQRRIDEALSELDHVRRSEVGFKTGHTYTDAAGMLSLLVDLRYAWILTLDLRDYFPSITWQRVRKVFETQGLSKEATRNLTRVSTWDGRLAQGSPCSPRLASLATQVLDAQIKSLAVKHGGAYVRYADDLTIALPGSLSNAEVQVVLNQLVKRIRGQGLQVARDKIHVNSPKRKVVEIVGARLHRLTCTLKSALKARRAQRFLTYLYDRGVISTKRTAKDGRLLLLKEVLSGIAANETLLSRADLKWSRVNGYTPPQRLDVGTYRAIHR